MTYLALQPKASRLYLVSGSGSMTWQVLFLRDWLADRSLTTFPFQDGANVAEKWDSPLQTQGVFWGSGWAGWGAGTVLFGRKGILSSIHAGFVPGEQPKYQWKKPTHLQNHSFNRQHMVVFYKLHAVRGALEEAWGWHEVVLHSTCRVQPFQQLHEFECASGGWSDWRRKICVT